MLSLSPIKTWLVSAGTLRKFYITLLLDFITSKVLPVPPSPNFQAKVVLLYDSDKVVSWGMRNLHFLHGWLDASSPFITYKRRYILLCNDNDLPVWCHLLACMNIGPKHGVKVIWKFVFSWLTGNHTYKMYVFWQHTILELHIFFIQ